MAKVILQQGILLGGKAKTANGYEYAEFLQIPYAKPPIGELRFKSPQQPEPWQGEKIVTTADKNKISYQFLTHIQTTLGCEDCLYLNVSTPVLFKETSKLLPVMVYIHGGGFIVGNGTFKEDNGPDYLIEQGVLVVSMNYRLGVYGFLSLDIPEAAGNMGLKDQLMALKWIQNNIDKFGGDKDNVTLFGISAGSASIEYLMLSPQSKGLFHKCILESGSSLNNWAINYDIKDLGIKLAQELGYEGSCNDGRRMYEYLMSQPTEVLGEASIKVSDMNSVRGTYFGFVPSIEKNFGDGEQFLTDYPYNLLKQGKFYKVPIIRGFCEFEGFLLMALKPKELEQVVEERNFIDYFHIPFQDNDGEKYRERLAKLYHQPGGQHSSNESLTIEFFGDLEFTSGILTSTKLMVEHGIPVYSYMFAYDGNANYLKLLFGIDKKGAGHGDEMMYILNVTTLTVNNTTKDDELVRKRICSMWAEFAKTGNPTPLKNETFPFAWPLYNLNDKNYLVIDKENEIKSSYEPERMALFEEIYEKYHK